jgi:hypothetical protein
LSARRVLRDVLKALSFRSFLGLDRLGLHVLPKHYYTSVADRSWLRAHAGLWQRRASLTGVRWDLDAQVAWLAAVCSPAHYAEVAGLASYADAIERGFGPGFGPIESQVLHCFVRAQAPARVVEVGGGVTTAVMARASALNAAESRRPTELVCIEPSPRAALLGLEGVRVVAEPLQAVSSAVFEPLGDRDVLFIDSSHAVKTGSELQRLYHEIVPGLPPGVTVHIHDIFLPYLYSPTVLQEYFDPQESSLVLALLTENDRLEVLCCQSALHHDRTERLASILPDYRPEALDDGLRRPGRADGHFPASLWLRTVR